MFISAPGEGFPSGFFYCRAAGNYPFPRSKDGIFVSNRIVMISKLIQKNRIHSPSKLEDHSPCSR
ncbi:hypothetical protein BES34_010885 [Leptospira inadai serovar Lyme]|uniref:Lipoprotein n=1 Tax=Leptospira inadai serovar Lyme TaxID=293084 RepID=A0ABX4YIF4_9LEPT|nr:hypothetical protein BES34_010885 [Leptospira inadai serovar Lyme]